jgi:hypothetical protein
MPPFAVPGQPAYGAAPAPGPFGAPTSPPPGGPTAPTGPAAPTWGGPAQPTAPTWGVPTPPTVATGTRRGRRFRKRHSFLLLFGVILLLVIVQVIVAPWAFHIGGKFTPLGNWTGAAQGKAPSGDRYAVQIQLEFNTLQDRACSQTGGCDDFHGTLLFCTKAGQYKITNMSGQLHGWLSTEGRTMNVDFQPDRKDSQQVQQVLGVFRGTWHGDVYQATDGGYLERDFGSNGVPRTVVTTADPKQSVTLAFQPADFNAMCAALKSG